MPQALLADPAITAVYVLTTMETHHDYVMRALRAGKHVLVEKPVGCSVGELDEMRQLADSQGLALVG